MEFIYTEWNSLYTHGNVIFFIWAAIEEQNEISWDKLLHTLWQSLQHHIDTNHDRPPKFSLRCWKARNVAKHGATFEERHQKALEPHAYENQSLI